MTLRPVTFRDVGALTALEREVFGAEAWDEPSWWGELARRPRREYVLDADDDDLRGYGGLDHAGEVSDVMTLAVAPAARGTGRGRVLLEELLRRAAARGAGHVMLEVRADNTAARALYDRAGFTVLRTRRRYYPDGGDALVLRLTLEEAHAHPR